MTASSSVSHPGELLLRRLLANEAVAEESKAHVASCERCTAKLSALRDEQARFEAEVPFERFAAGVEKAQRAAAAAPGARAASPRPVLMALAAGFVALVAGWAVFLSGQGSTSRLKGGEGTVDFVVAAQKGAQRTAREIEPLAPGERVRIGVSGYPFVLVLSVDDAGEVSTVYSGGDESMMLGAETLTWLPESLEFTGSGRELVSVFQSERPLRASHVGPKLKEAWQRAKEGQRAIAPVDVPGVQVHRTFIKP